MRYAVGFEPVPQGVRQSCHWHMRGRGSGSNVGGAEIGALYLPSARAARRLLNRLNIQAAVSVEWMKTCIFSPSTGSGSNGGTFDHGRVGVSAFFNLGAVDVIAATNIISLRRSCRQIKAVDIARPHVTALPISRHETPLGGCGRGCPNSGTVIAP